MKKLEKLWTRSSFVSNFGSEAPLAAKRAGKSAGDSNTYSKFLQSHGVFERFCKRTG